MEKMGGRKIWRPVCARSQEGEEKKIGREKLGRWATSGVRWKWVEPIKKWGRRKI